MTLRAHGSTRNMNRIRVRDEELVGLLGSVLPLSQTESGDRVSYFHPEQGHALDVVYGKRGRIVRCEPGPALTDELIATPRERAEAALAPDTGFEVRRDVLFSVPEVKGCWRHGDDWQIVPAPASAPRPGFLMGEHPFVLEYRVRRSANFQVAETRRWRRFWELHLLLSLLLHGRITREFHAHPHHWMLLHEPTADGSHTVYANEGYMIAGFVARADDFTDPSGYRKLAVVPDDEYYAQRGIGVDDDVTVPSSFDAFFDRFESADARMRDQLLRASYWLDTASRAWEISKSLSYVAAINAAETLMPEAEGRPVPDLLPRSQPGAGFYDFVETYAAAEGADARVAMYRFRSALVHGHRLHTMDLPGAWGRSHAAGSRTANCMTLRSRSRAPRFAPGSSIPRPAPRHSRTRRVVIRPRPPAMARGQNPVKEQARWRGGSGCLWGAGVRGSATGSAGPCAGCGARARGTASRRCTCARGAEPRPGMWSGTACACSGQSSWSHSASHVAIVAARRGQPSAWPGSSSSPRGRGASRPWARASRPLDDAAAGLEHDAGHEHGVEHGQARRLWVRPNFQQNI